MREIKFRAWDNLSKSWQPWRTPYQVENGAKELFTLDETTGNVYFSRGDVVLMQYTGLKDKNGVEIYEGDIIAPVEPSAKKHNREVRFVDGAFSYSLDGHLKPNYYSQITQGKANLFKVIGNIHENPELLDV